MRKVILALSAALVLASAPSFAQQKSTTSDRAMDRAKAMEKRVVDAFNKKDAAAVAALDLPNAISVGPDGKVARGRATIQAMYDATFKAWGDFKFTFVAQEAGPTGNGFWALYDSTAEIKGPNGPLTLHSHVLGVLVPQGKDWKFAAVSIGANVPPPPPGPPQR